MQAHLFGDSNNLIARNVSLFGFPIEKLNDAFYHHYFRGYLAGRTSCFSSRYLEGEKVPSNDGQGIFA